MEKIRYKIIMVDDNISNLNIGRDMLKRHYEVYPASSAAKLFEILDNVYPDLILLDVMMPEMSGYEVIKKLKDDARFSAIPVIFLTAKDDEDSELEGLNLGAMDYVTKPFSAPLLIKRIENQLLIVKQKRELKDYADNLELKVMEKTREVIDLQNAVLSTVTDLVECRDEFTGGHIIRTGLYLKVLAEELILEGPYAEEVAKWDMDFFLPSAQLHDVGKIKISDNILNKPGKLTAEEFEIMKTHVTIGVNTIERIMAKTEKHAFLNHAIIIAGTHHEKWDGTGYPNGLKGQDIPLEGRLMAIADVYDALISVRPYKPPLPHAEGCKIIEESSGTHFDPVLVDVFINVEDKFAKIVKEIDG